VRLKGGITELWCSLWSTSLITFCIERSGCLMIAVNVICLSVVWTCSSPENCLVSTKNYCKETVEIILFA
jgi:hypothetical protein